MQNFHMMYNIDTPYKHSYFDTNNSNFIDSFLNFGSNEPYNNHGLGLEHCWRDEDYYYPKKNVLIPHEKFDFGSYFKPANCKQEFHSYSDESRLSHDDETNLHSQDMQSPSKMSQNDLFSVSGSNHYNSEIQDMDSSEKDLKNRRKSLVSRVSKNSKKIQKKSKGKKKAKKSRRMSERLKNIVKNYGKNCATFAISELGHPFLIEVLNEDEISRFKEYIRLRIPNIINIANFREMLLVSEHDDAETGKFKKAFQFVSEIFIRDYSFNWIFHSPRINDVKGHLFARFKMLRRIRDPKNFTYIH